MDDISILEWLESEGRTAASLAREVGISKGHLSHVMSGRLRVSALVARRIEAATSGKVSAASLRPDIFGEIVASASNTDCGEQAA